MRAVFLVFVLSFSYLANAADACDSTQKLGNLYKMKVNFGAAHIQKGRHCTDIPATFSIAYDGGSRAITCTTCLEGDEKTVAPDDVIIGDRVEDSHSCSSIGFSDCPALSYFFKAVPPSTTRIHVSCTDVNDFEVWDVLYTQSAPSILTIFKNHSLFTCEGLIPPTQEAELKPSDVST